MGDVGRGAAHVEADQMALARLGRGPHHADDAAGRPGEDRILAAEGGGVGEAAVRLHEEQAARAGQAGDHLVDVAAQHRREIGVDHRCVAAADQLDQRLDLVARRDLGEADLPRDLRKRRLVVGPAPAVHQHDRERAKALLIRRPQPGFRRRAVERAQHVPLGGHALVHLDDMIVERLGQEDMPGEDVRPCLVADPQASPSPAVIASATRSPFRSSKALVATVVPIFTAPSAPPPASSRICPIPATAASS
jgi:hypothetical protein